MDDTRPLASLSLTHVYYDPSDPLSLVCAWLALLPQALCIVYATLAFASREAEVALMFAGQLACEAVNFALKRLIKEDRPRRIHGKGYGMPSSHAQFVAFWALYLVLFLFVRHRGPPARQTTTDDSNSSSSPPYRSRALSRAERAVAALVAVATAAAVAWSRVYLVLFLFVRHRGPPARQTAADGASSSSSGNRSSPYRSRALSRAERAVAALVAVATAAAVAWSRVYLGYHTTKQVLVGLAAGAACAVAWFAATTHARDVGLLAWVLRWPVVRWFRVRDLLLEEDFCQAGWERWEEKRVREDDALVRQEKAKKR
ncbi:hypothetical protein BN1723_017846 [Verticillium longisporum]|uniref:Dolichyldiphosphatase n=2 Tax=Verticillium longisporum TaxID=100787 RepID=A0A0G4LDU8_VERLO|nr:hypothetical protein BN1723_017846 [Verticillium longisporum]